MRFSFLVRSQVASLLAEGQSLKGNLIIFAKHT